MEGSRGNYMLRKRFSLLTMVSLVALSLLAGSMLNIFSSDTMYEQLTKFKDVLSLTEKYYVEDVDSQKLTESAITGVLSQLDPHSVYIPGSQLQRVNEEFQGSFDGIGIEYQVLNDTLLVVAPIVGGPSEAVGVQSGDKIVRIDDTSAVGITQAGVQRKLRGPRGTKVRIFVLRPGLRDGVEFEITRDKIPLYTVDVSFMVDGTTGYLNVTRFAATTYQEFSDAVARLRAQGMKRLVLDLRSNAGGYLEQSFKMANELLAQGKKIVYTKGRRPEFDEEYVATGSGKSTDIPLVILVNNGSASASEIVAGAVQDHDRGLIVGETTFGKGLVQRQFDLKDGSALRLTTARYFTPSGRLIQRPYNGDRTAYHREAFEREEAEGENLQHSAEGDSGRPKYTTAGGRTVYGGGGVTPDIIVKADRLTEYTVQLRNRQVFLQWADRYLERNGDALRASYGEDVARFAREFEVTPVMMDEIRALAKAKGVTVQPDQESKDMTYIKAFAAASVGRSLWRNEGYTRVMLREDAQFNRALAAFPEAEKIAGLVGSKKP
jgi:carboxyl-terminal processing protease